MTIKKKLLLNALLTLAGIAVIGGVSLLGIKFVQGKLFVLTERSTPYQLKTIESQRFLQEHTSNLLKVAFSASAADLKNSRADAEKSMSAIQKVSGELDALKAQGSDGGGKEKLERLESVTREMFATTEARLRAEEKAKGADQAMKAKLQEITRKLAEMDDSIKKRQKSSARQLSASSGSARDITQKLMSLTTARDSIKDANFAFTEIQKATGKKGVIIARGKLETALSEFAKNRLVTSGDPSIKALVDMVADIKKLILGPQGVLELKGVVLSKGADGSAKDYEQVVQNVSSKLSAAVIEIDQAVTLATESYGLENRNHDTSLKGSNTAGDVLALNGELISVGLDIKSTIKELFASRTTEELTRSTNDLKAKFAAADAAQRKMVASLAGSKKSAEAGVLRGVAGALNEVQALLLAKGGVVEQLQQVVVVEGQAMALNGKLKELVAQQNEEAKRGVTTAQAEQEKAVTSVNSMVRSFVLAVSAIGLGMIVFGLLSSLYLARSITTPVHELMTLAERFGNGDFSSKMDENRKDEFGELARYFNKATVKLGEITQQLASAITDLAAHSRKLSGTAEELSHGAREQAMQTEQSASAMTEMSQTINDVAGSAAQAADAAQHSLKTANQGNALVDKTAAGMEKIAVSVRDASALIQNLSEHTEQVGSIIGIINDIADQTNLLALNAAIEAARAGEMGMGFSVVADEVRKLAARTTDATADVAAMIKQMQTGTVQTVNAMRDGNAMVEEGVKEALMASQSLGEIVEASNRGADMVERIAIAAEEQSAAAAQISASMESIALITRKAESSTQEIERSSSELEHLAGELSRMAAWFKG